MNVKRFLAIGLLLILPLALLTAQADGPVARLVYYDAFEVVVVVPEADNTVTTYSDDIGNLVFDLELPPGSRIQTVNGTAELQLDPNGSIMKLAPGTDFTIDSLSPSRNSGNNNFAVTSGRVRTVAARLGGSANMRIRSTSAIAGVRGTDFTFDANSNELFVLEGLVDFGPASESGFDFAGEIVQLAQNQFANATELIANAFDPEQFAEQFADLNQFSENVDTGTVPTELEDEEPAEEEESAEEEAEDEEAAEDGDSADPVVVQNPAAGDGGDEGTEGEEEDGLPDTIPEDSIIMDALGWLGMEIGSITIDGETYSKAVFQPEFSLGKLQTQLYLPIIYTSNFLDPDDWYRPRGNDEWSFGTDQDQEDILAVISDFTSDLVLKFKYLQWGDLRDPFFFQLGNVESMTLGHGILIRGYANDADFPSVRRIGVNLGITTPGLKIQTLVNDLSDPFLYGFRIQFGARAGFAISAAADLTPWEVFDGVDPADLNDDQEDALSVKPAFINAAVDLDMPIMENDILSLVFFADAASLLPYLGESNSDLGLEEGFKFDAIFTEDGFRNYGIEAGAFGNVLFIDYRLQFQYYTGSFIPGFYNQPYDRIRGERAVGVVNYLQNPEAEEYDSYTMGVYGQGGFSLFQDRLTLEMGYLWPWTIDQTTNEISTDAEDYFNLSFGVDKELLSFLPWEMEASLAYDRVRFRDVFQEDAVTKLFDENATLKGEGVVAIAPGINLAFTVSTNVLRDENGNIVYRDGKPVIGPSIGLETRIGN